VLAVLCTPDAADAQYSAFAPEAERDASRLVAMLKTTFEDEAGERLGAGILVGAKDGVLYIATANHNVRWGSARIASLQVFLDGDETAPLAGTVLPEFDAALDLAVVSVRGLKGRDLASTGIPYERLGDADSLERGDEVSMLGHPSGHAWEMALHPDRLSGTRADRLLFQSTFIASGHSGGALLDEHLDVVGLIRSDQPPYGEAVKIGKVLERLRAWGIPVQLGRDLRAPRFVHVAAAADHACALTAEGDAYCFGSPMGAGALGHGTGAASDRLRRVLGGHRFRQVGVGRDHSCGLDTDGRAWCWGSNVFGELGNGSPQDAREETRVPVAVAGGIRFAGLGVGSFHSCGLAADGSAWCWADYERRIRAPRRMRSDTRFASVHPAQQVACALTAEGQVHCWSLNPHRDAEPKDPALAFATPRFTKLAVGGDSNPSICGLAANGALCWGPNMRGQLGDGRGGEETLANDSSTPVAVSGRHAFAAITVGQYHACGLARDGKAWCWGANDDGQLGDGTATDRNVPTRVGGGLGFTALSAGSGLTCGVAAAGVVYCWGKVNDRVVTEPTHVPVHGE
jgi:alpha-tubulin suppressor-like RCC1 family protein